MPGVFAEHVVSGHFLPDNASLPLYSRQGGQVTGLKHYEMTRLEHDEFVLSVTNRRVKNLHW